MKSTVAIAVGSFALATAALGWSGFEVTEDGLTLAVDEIPPIADPSTPSAVTVRVRNGTAASAAGRVEIRDLVDDWRVIGPSTAAFDLAAKGSTSLSFRISSGPFVFDALYPVHAYARVRSPERPGEIHAVRIFEVKREKAAPTAGAAKTPPANRLAPDSVLPLWQLRTQRVGWQWKDQPPRFYEPGWFGSDPDSHASANVSSEDCGGRRETISMHPAYAKSPGTVFCDYLVALPAQTPIAFTAAVALHHGGETDKMRSDGILYRVSVADAAQPDRFVPVFEEFTDARQWKDVRASLDAYAGRTVLLRIECHPGPKWNTGFDSGHWAEPSVAAGRPPAVFRGPPTPADTAAASADAKAILEGRLAADGRTNFLLAGSAAAPRTAVAVRPGARGLLDAVVAVAAPCGVAAFRGFDVRIEDASVPPALSATSFRGAEAAARSGGMRWVHHLERDGQPFDLAIEVRAEGPALKVQALCPRRITAIALGPWDRAPKRVFYGHGYAIENPAAFRQSFGGHNLATSHAGFEFGGGTAVLQAFDHPPRTIEVDPARQSASLVSDLDATMTLLPGTNAMDCAVAYRPLDPRKPAGGVKRLAGRYCFDIWGGSYGDIAGRMQEAFRYGLTDSFLTIHDWQRWGYDYRLPDLWPPNPRYGSLDDLRRVGELCRARDVPWGLHDNYIDFYPDAQGYSYRNVYFTQDGRPHRAWYNEGRDALSYKWRPDRIMPFVERNYRLIRDGVHPSHVFVDVFTSQGTGPFWDHEGAYHPSTEMRRCWGEMFAWMRDCLGGDAPTTSEAGHDQLIGWLDGADCQWMTLAPRGAKHVTGLAAGDWERVPWYDPVHHDRFILHGAGYSSRYQGGRPRDTHGINSDDYLSSEVLAGHALMTDAGSWGRAAVRKYWLAQDLARHLALRNIRAVRFEGGDLHRQRVEWDDGTTVWVNRSDADWTVAGRVLPSFGFVAAYGAHTAAVERIGGRIAESSRGPSGLFCNARTMGPERARRLDIAPRVEDFRDLGGGRFAWTLAWTCREPAPRDVNVFVHFRPLDGNGEQGDILFQGDYHPTPPTSKWSGELKHPRESTAPADLRGPCALVVGLWDRAGRLRIRGPEAEDDDIRVGTVFFEGPAGRPPTARFEPAQPAQPGLELNPPGTMLDFGFAVTDGAFRLSPCDGGARLIPLPDQGTFRVAVRLPGARGEPRVVAEPMDPKAAETPVACDYRDGMLSFRCDGAAFAYRIAAETK